MAYLEAFFEHEGINNNLCLVGNSLGGHLALLYVLKNPSKVDWMILTGSSGLYEVTPPSSVFLRRKDLEVIRNHVYSVFYHPKTASNTLIDSVHEITRNLSKGLRVAAIAKSAQRQNLSDRLCTIETPTQIIWGLNDTITPTNVAHEFYTKLPNARLDFHR